MRIALVIPTFRVGGAERVMSILARGLSDRHDIHLVFQAIHDPFYDIPDNVSVHYVDTVRPDAPLADKVSAYVMGLRRLRKLLKTIRPDIIVSFNEYKYDHVVILADMFLRTPIVVSDRSSPLRYRRCKRFARRLVYQLADAIVVQTDFAKNYYERHFRRKHIALIHNPVSVPVLSPGPRERLILNVGRLVADKGHEYLIRAFAELNLDGWRMAIIGDGPLRDELKHLAVQLGIAEKVVFPGVVKDIASYLRKASIFVLPSIREGFPNALAEAMVAGVACVSFDCKAGPSELIQDGSNGFLVQTRDIAGLTQRIAMLVADEKLRMEMGAEARKTVLCFSEGQAIEKWESLFQSLCRSRR